MNTLLDKLLCFLQKLTRKDCDSGGTITNLNQSTVRGLVQKWSRSKYLSIL